MAIDGERWFSYDHALIADSPLGSDSIGVPINSASPGNMPSANEFWEVASEVASQRGGLVVAFVGDGPPPELGTTLHSVLGFTAPAAITISSVLIGTTGRNRSRLFIVCDRRGAEASQAIPTPGIIACAFLPPN